MTLCVVVVFCGVFGFVPSVLPNLAAVVVFGVGAIFAANSAPVSVHAFIKACVVHA
jgi:hypothetical protein